jgi:hypothetical protein
VANDYVKHVLGIDWESFKYKVYVVPPGDLCSWGGMGWVGCKSDCRAWISGDLWMVRVAGCHFMSVLKKPSRCGDLGTKCHGHVEELHCCWSGVHTIVVPDTQ